MTGPGPLQVLRGAGGGLALCDGLGRVVAILPAPDMSDQRLGSPYRADQMARNAALFVEAEAMLVTLQGTSGLLAMDMRPGGALRDSKVWSKAHGLINAAIIRATLPVMPT